MTISSTRKAQQEDWEFKVISGYTVSSVPVLATRDRISKHTHTKKNRSKQETMCSKPSWATQ